jgi:hypothetical protein
MAPGAEQRRPCPFGEPAPAAGRGGRGAVIPRAVSSARLMRAYRHPLEAFQLVRILARRIAKRGRDLASAGDAELDPERVGVRFCRPRRDPQAVGDLDIRAAPRDQVDDLPLPLSEPLAPYCQHGPDRRASRLRALLAGRCISRPKPRGLAGRPESLGWPGYGDSALPRLHGLDRRDWYRYDTVRRSHSQR